MSDGDRPELIGAYQPSDEHGELPSQAADRYARAGMSVFPVDMRPDENNAPRKQPPCGYAWKQRATSVVKEVVEDFVEAELAIGPENVGIGWALGLDGKLGVDLDGIAPEWWGELTSTAVNPTKRGEHRVFRQPADRRIGNSTSRFPSQGWGEVRGVGGYIVIWWSDRPGFDPDDLHRVAEFPHPEWLTDSDDEAPGCSPFELEQFKNEHTAGHLGPIKGYETLLAKRELGSSRNFHATKVACWIAREASAGLVPAREAFDALERWWSALGPENDTDGVRKTRKLPRSEILRIERWAIGQLTPERVEETRAKASAKRDEWEAEQEASSGNDEQAQPDDEQAQARLLTWKRAPDPFPIPRIEWLIEGMWCAGTHGELAGPEKSLKSVLSAIIDVGLAAGVPVLGKFNVPEPRFVLHLAGEGGEVGYWTRIGRVCNAYGITVDQVRDNLLVTFGTASMSSTRFVQEMEQQLDTNGPALVHLDPYYAYSPRGVDSRQLVEVGAALETFGALCARYDSTLLINNHFNQTGSGQGLTRITGAGHAEWVDSWLLVNHRDQPDVDNGRFRLRLDVGSRQWGGTSWELDLDLGKYDPATQLHVGTMKWSIRPALTTTVSPQDAHDAKIAQAELNLMRVARRKRKPFTKNDLVAEVNGTRFIVLRAFDLLVDAGHLVEVGKRTVPFGKRARDVPVFQVKTVP